MSIFAALLTKVSNNGKVFQAKFLGKTKANIRNLAQYGFFSIPPVDSKLVMFKDVFESYYAIGYKDSIIPILKQNETVMGNFVKGSVIKFDENGNIDITCTANETITITGNCTINCVNANINASTKATITAPTTDVIATTAVNITSPLTTITGALTVTGTTTIETKPFLPHTHSGVTVGAGVTGGVV